MKKLIVKINKRAEICGTKVCIGCGKEFPVNGYQVLQKKYCGDRCYDKSYIERRKKNGKQDKTKDSI